MVDPTKVTRSALQNATSAASLLLPTEALVVEIPEKRKAAPAGPHGGGGGGGYEDMYLLANPPSGSTLRRGFSQCGVRMLRLPRHGWAQR